MRELGLTGLEITQDNNVVRLERNIPASQTGQTVSIAADPAAAAAAEAADSSAVSYTHLDVYKRQIASATARSTDVPSGLSPPTMFTYTS